jgi:hypothetical protein
VELRYDALRSLGPARLPAEGMILCNLRSNSRVVGRPDSVYSEHGCKHVL